MTVFANMLEVSAKKQGCKVLAAFPDVCFTPPQTPATPPGVPIPYPNFGMDSDLASGSSTVKIGGEPVSQENASNYSKCSGDEAGCAPKKGMVTSKNMGKIYAQMWSMDVKADGKGLVRFGDMVTGNHASNPSDGSTNVKAGTANPATTPCAHSLDTRESTVDRAAERQKASDSLADAQAKEAAAVKREAELEAMLKMKPNVRPGKMTNTQIRSEQKTVASQRAAAARTQTQAQNKIRGLDNEMKVANDVGKSKNIEIYCKKCNEVLQELDVVTEDGRAKEVKSSAAGFDSKKLADKKKYVEDQKLLGPGVIVKFAMVGGVPQELIDANPELAGRTQDH